MPGYMAGGPVRQPFARVHFILQSKIYEFGYWSSHPESWSLQPKVPYLPRPGTLISSSWEPDLPHPGNLVSSSWESDLHHPGKLISSSWRADLFILGILSSSSWEHDLLILGTWSFQPGSLISSSWEPDLLSLGTSPALEPDLLILETWSLHPDDLKSSSWKPVLIKLGTWSPQPGNLISSASSGWVGEITNWHAGQWAGNVGCFWARIS